MAEGDLQTGLIRVTHKADADTLTSGHSRYEIIKIGAVGTDSEKTISLSWLYDIDMESGELYGITDDSDGSKAEDPADEISAWSDVGQIGVLTQAASANDTVLSVNDTVAANADIGDFITIAAATTEYEIIAKDIANLTVTLAGTGLDAGASANDAVKMLRYFIGTSGVPLELGLVGGRRNWGEDTFDSARLPVGKVLKIKFKNTSSTVTKTVRGHIAILY